MDSELLSLPPCDRIHGLDDAKLAMVCMAVDDNIKSLLIRGPAGVGKTAVARTLAGPVMGRRILNIPINTTDEHLLGSLDIDAAVTEGKIGFKKGLLGEADDRILYIDDVNRFDRRLFRILMESVSEGRVMVERDGMSADYECDTVVIATSNTNEPPLNRNLSDRFDLSVTIRGSDDRTFRTEVVKSNIFSDDCEDLYWNELKNKIDKARKILPSVTISDDLMESVVNICSDWGVKSYRGELSTIRVSKVLAALGGRTSVSKNDITGAALLCLDHRRERVYVPSKRDKAQVNFHAESHMKRFIHDDRIVPEDAETTSKTVSGDIDVSAASESDVEIDVELDDVYTDIGEMFKSIDFKEAAKRELDIGIKKKFVREDGREGKFVSSEPMKSSSDDIAFYATVREAAPFQEIRHRENGRNMMFLIEKDDLMKKVYERKVSSMFLFMIDTSGSLIIRGRMRAVKAAILSMLADHYNRKDMVAVMSFNEEKVGMVMPPTRSVGGVKKTLDDLAVGRKTPLSEGLTYAGTFMSQYARKHPSEECYVILMTDAKANIAMSEGEDPFEEAMAVAEKIDIPNTKWILVDTSADTDEEERAKRLSLALRSMYYSLDELHTSEGLLAKPSGKR